MSRRKKSIVLVKTALLRMAGGLFLAEKDSRSSDLRGVVRHIVDAVTLVAISSTNVTEEKRGAKICSL